MSGDLLPSLFYKYVELIQLFNGHVFIPVHQGRVCKPRLSYDYWLDEDDCGGACGPPCFSMPPQDLVKHILSCVGLYGGLRGRVENGVVVELESLRYHIPPKKK